MIDPNILSKAIAGIEPAFFGSEFHPDVLPPIPEISGKPFDKKEADLALLHRIQRTRRAAPPEAGDSSLVQRRKSPTARERLAQSLANDQREATRADWRTMQHETHVWQQFYEKTGEFPSMAVEHASHERDYSIRPSDRYHLDKTTGELVGTKSPTARIYYRDWSEEYRVRVEVQTSVSNPPEANNGERKTEELNGRAASKIMDSGAYVQAVRGGFTTFLTLTFAPAARARIISGESTIGKEVSRFFDAAKKMYRRGWATDHEVLKHKNGFDCIGAECLPADTQHDDEFDYIWCAEMPKNEDGEPNPHCHVLLRWEVPEYLFFDWAYRIEQRLWGQGFAKLERIRDARAAGGYLLKALGYVTKGVRKDQGLIHGNRYNISKSARAPKWECIASFYADNMTAIINELRDRWHWEDAPLRAQIKDRQAQLAQKKKAYMIAKHQKRTATAEKLKARLEQLTADIKERWQKIKGRQARADEYQITMKGAEKIHKFLTWATARRGWRAEEPESPELTDEYRQQKIEWIKTARKAWRNAAAWAGFNWFNTTHERVTIDAGTMADWAVWEQYAATLQR